MNRFMLAAALVGAAFALELRADDAYATRGRAFLEGLSQDKVEAKVVADLQAALDAQLAAKPDGEADFIGESLLVAYPDYRQAMKSWYRQYYEQAAAQLKKVAAATDNEHLLAHANYFIARTDLQLGKFDEAERTLAALVDPAELAKFHRDYEVVFYYGLAQGQLLKRENALKTFETFMKSYPAAPERYRVLATNIARELKVRGENELYDLSDRMTLVQNWLSKQQSGTPVQKGENEIVSVLDRLIKLAEEQEQGSCSGGGAGQGRGAARGMGKGGPATAPSLPTGPVRPPQLAERDARDTGRAWGQLPEKDRKEITQFLDKNFPERYRHLLQQYYSELSKSNK